MPVTKFTISLDQDRLDKLTDLLEHKGLTARSVCIQRLIDEAHTQLLATSVAPALGKRVRVANRAVGA